MKPLPGNFGAFSRLLVLGYCTRPLADAIRRSRIWSKDRFVFLDFFGDMDQKTSVQNFSLAKDFGRGFSETDLKKTIEELTSRFGRFDGVIYNSGIENRPGLLEWLKEQGVAILGNDPDVLRASRNPDVILPLAARHGAYVPETFAVSEGGPCRSIHSIRDSRQKSCRRWLLKPTFSAGGSGIKAVPDGSDVATDGGLGESGVKDSREAPAYVIQEYIEGISCSAVFVADGRHTEVLGVSRQLIGDADFGGRRFAYCGNIIPLDVPMGSAAEKIKRLCAGLTVDLGLKGLNCIDFILKDEGIWFLEINPRYSASMELLEAFQTPTLPLIEIHLRALGVDDGEDVDDGGDLSLPRREFEWAFPYGEGTPDRTDGTGGHRLWGAGKHVSPSYDKGLPPYYHQPRAAGKAIVYATKEVTVPDDVPERWLARGIRDVPFPGEVIPADSPICTVLAHVTARDAGNAGEECMRALRIKAAEVRHDLGLSE
ncbi:MAG TPA: ATP-grasp domain-containing protein [Clostridia bacterium]|nr:ATP-grasp domain-containing protein [Clostridia bacterium]